jgi:hypothetical protein
MTSHPPGKEEVFAFSPNAGSKAIILQHYGNWPRVYARETWGFC